MRMVEVHDLVKAFPAVNGQMHRAVDGIGFHVNAGEIYGLLGPNGAGKTTTLRMLSGLLKPTGGRIVMNGIELADDPNGIKRSIGFLTAHTGLYHRLSPREVLDYFGELHGLERDTKRRRIDELIDWLQMKPFAETRCGALSTGQRQRTNIARALIADPPILILDEPTLGLDVLTNRLILEFIGQERARGKAVILSTHYLDEAEKLCDRVGLLHCGRFLDQGDLPSLRGRCGQERLTDIFLHLVGAHDAVLADHRPSQNGGAIQ